MPPNTANGKLLSFF